MSVLCRFRQSGTTLVSGSYSGSYDGTVKLWDVATHENIATLEGHTWFCRVSVVFTRWGNPRFRVL